MLWVRSTNRCAVEWADPAYICSQAKQATPEKNQNLEVTETGVEFISPFSLGIQFFVAINNTSPEDDYDVEVTPKKCCINIVDGRRDCEVLNLVGGRMENIAKGAVETVILVAPTVDPFERVGSCIFYLDSNVPENPLDFMRDEITVNFDTRLTSNRSTLIRTFLHKNVAKCRDPDADPLNHCRPVVPDNEPEPICKVESVHAVDMAENKNFAIRSTDSKHYIHSELSKDSRKDAEAPESQKDQQGNLSEVTNKEKNSKIQTVDNVCNANSKTRNDFKKNETQIAEEKRVETQIESQVAYEPAFELELRSEEKILKCSNLENPCDSSSNRNELIEKGYEPVCKLDIITKDENGSRSKIVNNSIGLNYKSSKDINRERSKQKVIQDSQQHPFNVGLESTEHSKMSKKKDSMKDIESAYIGSVPQKEPLEYHFVVRLSDYLFVKSLSLKNIPVTYPTTAPEIALPGLDGKTAKMYRGGKICLTDHFKPLWARNVPKFGIAHAMALGLGPWLAVEVPELIERGVVTYQEKGETK
ncbi:Ubiquitin-fold modifier-conjugating enzyme 1 [Eumeta japonica]|uniref:Ubiquitin-fold modifier-conjugating enzyme 1 n=1 Tax=Eumeta variegata TaxID=151549 RepID=A0A4C1Z880_EUMVA|nr:Ubiquitin-fold modifier-conjugating enzyme 1 [Eumeta japonica]